MHAGWQPYLAELTSAMQHASVHRLSPSLCEAWGLSAEQTLWDLLRSPRVARVLCVGHSMGGALATMAATLLGATGSVGGGPPLLVTFGCALVPTLPFHTTRSHIVFAPSAHRRVRTGARSLVTRASSRCRCEWKV